MFELRLGDIIDDFCVKCRRLTNHAIVSIVEGAAAKVRCRTCYHDHDYRHEQPPPSKKDLKKAELFAEVLASTGANGVTAESAAEPSPLILDPTVEEALAAEADLDDVSEIENDAETEADTEDEIETGDEPVAVEDGKKPARKTSKK